MVNVLSDPDLRWILPSEHICILNGMECDVSACGQACLSVLPFMLIIARPSAVILSSSGFPFAGSMQTSLRRSHKRHSPHHQSHTGIPVLPHFAGKFRLFIHRKGSQLGKLKLGRTDIAFCILRTTDTKDIPQMSSMYYLPVSGRSADFHCYRSGFHPHPPRKKDHCKHC